MSGSFWKFGQDYSVESSITKLLNGAFVKLHDSEALSKSATTKIDTGESRDSSVISSEIDEDAKGTDVDAIAEDQDTANLPDNEEDYKDYGPNLDVLDALLDDEELYTELMCSNFKLLIYLKYPEVLQQLVDYVTSEHVLSEALDDADLETVESFEEQNEEPAPYHDANGKRIDDLTGEGEAPLQSTEDTETSTAANGDLLNNTADIQSTTVTEGDLPITQLKDSDGNSVASEETSVTVPPESEEQLESRRARMAAEILSADIWPIASTIMEHTELLDQLWAIMDYDNTLSIAASTYFMKINERLLDMDVSGILTFIIAQKTCVDRFLKHIENPSLMDFLLKVISTDKQDSTTGIINELKAQDIIPKLIDRLDQDKYSTSVQSAAGDFLKAFVTLSANSNNEIALGIGPNELTRQLVSPPMVERLIQIMLKGKTSLSNGVGIIIELIRKNNSDYDFIQVMYTTIKTHPPNDRDPVHLIALVEGFAKHMDEFATMLRTISLPPMETPFGEIEPLGFERFKICELVAELLHCSNMTLLNEPNGKKVTSNRDSVREETLKEEGENVAENETDGDLSAVTNDVKNMDISTDQDTTDENDQEAVDENDTEVYPDDQIDNSVEAEKELRDKYLPGDQLKFALKDTCIIRDIVDMFFQFKWNNFLHNVVFDIVQQIFNGPLKSGYNKFLLSDLLEHTVITNKITTGDAESEKYETETGIRLGYMGHLTLIAEEVGKFDEYVEELKLTFTDSNITDALGNEEWKTYMDTTLRDIREKYNTVLGDFVLEDVDADDYDDHLLGPDSAEIQMENNNALLDSISREREMNGDERDPLDDTNLQEPQSFEDLQEATREADDYIENNDDLNTESFYKYSQEPDEDTIHEDLSASKDGGNFGSFYEYIDASGHRTTLNLESFKDEENEGEEGPGNEFATNDKDISAVYKNQFNLSAQDREHEEFSNSLQHDFIDYSPTNEGEDDDDYMDPNDDGQSYAKPNNPLYNSTNLLSSNIRLSDEDLALHDEGSDVDSAEDYSSGEENEVDVNSKVDTTTSLYRAPSKED